MRQKFVMADDQSVQVLSTLFLLSHETCMLICWGLPLLGFAVAGLLHIGHEANHMTPSVAVSQQCVAASVHNSMWQSSPNTTTAA